MTTNERLSTLREEVIRLREALTKIRVTAKLGTSMLGIMDLAPKEQAASRETLERIAELARRALDEGGFA